MVKRREIMKSESGFVVLLLISVSLSPVSQVSGNFNLYVDKEEFHRITGGTLSQVYLVRDGVVNDYALGYVMTVPYHIQYLDFKWQATNKKPVHYKMLIEFSDFFALLQPSANISKVGRLPHKLETFRVTIPCSGRLSTEVPVIIRFTFHVKHDTKNNGQGHNVTNVNVKRNKICLLKKNHHHQSSGGSLNEYQSTHNHSPKEKRTHLQQSPAAIPDPHPHLVHPIDSNITALVYPTTPTTSPSILLAGLLGACGVTASIVLVIFFICLKRRLSKLDATSSGHHGIHTGTSGSGCGSTGSSGGSGNNGLYYQSTNNDPSNSTGEDSPACLLRGTPNNHSRGLNWMVHTKNGKDESLGAPPLSPTPPPLPNSYVTIASFWNDILAPGSKGSTGGSRLNGSTFLSHQGVQKMSPVGNGSKGSDVSPYAYAQIIHPQQPPIEWYKSNLVSSSNGGRIYANHMSSFATGNQQQQQNHHHTSSNPNFGGVAIVVGTGYEGGVAAVGNEDYENYGGRSLGSGSIFQIDGFQCPKSFAKEANVVERFL